MPTIFEEERDYYLSHGLPYYQAKQRARDYYKSFTTRETSIEFLIHQNLSHGPEVASIMQSSDNEHLLNSAWMDSNLTPEERSSFRELVELVIEYCYSFPSIKAQRAGVKWLAYILRDGNLEHLLSEERQQWVEAELKGTTSLNKNELPTLLGYPPASNHRVNQAFEHHLESFQRSLRKHVRQKIRST